MSVITSKDQLETRLKAARDYVAHLEAQLDKGRPDRNAEQPPPVLAFFEEIPAALYQTSINGDILAVNEACVRLLGYDSVEELLRCKVADHMVEHGQREKQIAAFMAAGGVTTVEIPLRRKDGRVIWVRDTGQIVRGSDGEPLYLTGILEDISEQRRIARELARERNNLRTLIDCVPDSIFFKDRNSRYVMSNRAHLRVLGANSMDEVRGQNDFDFFPEPLARKYFEDEQKLMGSSRDFFADEETVVAASGESFWVRVVKSVLRDEKGEATGVVGISSDITERKKIEESIKTRLDALIQPSAQMEGMSFSEVFNVDEIQLIQDALGRATRVCSVIVSPEGRALTRVSEGTPGAPTFPEPVPSAPDACRSTFQEIVAHANEQPRIADCQITGLLMAGANIRIDNRHIGTWLIGPLRNEADDIEEGAQRARELGRKAGAEPDETEQMYRSAETISREHFNEIGQVVFLMARELSNLALRNVQQARALHQRDLAQKALKESEARLDLAQRASGLGLWDVEWKTGRSHWNEQMHALLGLPADRTNPTWDLWIEHIHPKDRRAFEEGLEESFYTNGEGFSMEHRILRENRKVAWVSSRAEVAEWNENGTPRRVIGTTGDITQRKLDEDELIRAKEAAEAADRAKSEFLALMSHEIRTPLNSVLGCTALMKESTVDAEQAELLDIISSGGETLLNLINDILDLSKIESGHMELENAPFDPRQLVNEVRDLLAYHADSKGLNLNVDIRDNMPAIIEGDRTRLRQILTNLANNAIKFTEEGSVSILGRAEAIGPAERGLHRYRIFFSIKDTGIGISDDQKSRLFRPFAQADSTTSRRYGGTGLGLVICKRLSQAMGGEISVQSKLGEGSTFTVNLTAIAQVEPDQLAASYGEHKTKVHSDFARLYPLRILVADDVPENLKLCVQILRRLGYHPAQANDGTEVLDLLKEHRFDVVFLDVRMPVLNGIEAARQIRENGITCASARIPLLLVALTADAMKSDREQCLEAGMTHYLTKPLRFNELSRTLQDLAAQIQQKTANGKDS